MGWEVQPGMYFNPFSYTETAFAIYALYYYISLYLPKTNELWRKKAAIVAACGAEADFQDIAERSRLLA